MRAGSVGLVPALSERFDKPARNGRWSDLCVRMASALVLGPIALFCLWRGGLAWTMLIGVAMAGLGHEWARLAKLRNAWPLLGLLVLIWLVSWVYGVSTGIQATVFMTFVAWLAYGRFAAAGVPYAGLGGVCLIWLRQRPGVGLEDTAYLILVIWGTDIGAYAVGRLLGGRKLAPRISPGKTWSGALGGLVLGAACGAGLAAVTLGAPIYAFGAGLMLSFIAQAGDLLESAIKRKLGVKDSARTIPGHGGLFDRLDGFLTAAPLAALLAASMHGGVGLWG
ncbi:MAG: phosphatidate cytidylyltransferase [Rhodospirillales bacterium]|nr:phosphatidate cytidylyltransferase [Rhodospirillales bacterium]MDE2319173.1 phosphatidate cytidylyltransferase [Rhodospirillales bacterium]